ncbi:pyridoxamine 5'-phosphate oxidase family protein [[Clostridium] spiroforme]|nr:pyridoxamine 5'-phosphate oxidase family protein [Thomasclavelia spiroformis]MBM6879057.1 pyridoxamine 5'-phosphate oxidase family protein [Thomasclavelia spiroformis]MBM6930664.1 pyridoxamine 5'-phosphate oxidase family protein [Thomasclavelia spiroformis]
MNEVYEFLKQANTYFLATNDQGQPRNRPFGTIDLYQDKLYIQTGLSKDCAKQMLADPRIEICAMVNDRWIRIQAKACLDDNIEAQKHMLEQYPSLQAMYQPGDGNTAVFYLQDVTASICSFTEAPKVITF